MKHHYTLFLFFLMSFISPNYAQVSFIIPDKKVVKGELVGAEIRVKTRDTISALQFTLEWNPYILEYNKIDSIMLTDVSGDIFGLTNVVDGNLKFLWVSNASEGVKFRDSVLIFKVLFKAIGAKGANSAVKFTNSLIRIKAINYKVESLPVTTRDGLMTIDNTSSVNNTEENNKIKLFQSIPNPASNQVRIPFELTENERISFEIYDSIGRSFFQKIDNYPAGKHEILLNTEGVLPKGMYMYMIKTKDAVISKKMIISR